MRLPRRRWLVAACVVIGGLALAFVNLSWRRTKPYVIWGQQAVPVEVAEILESPDHFELISIRASDFGIRPFSVLGSADLTGTETSREMVAALRHSIENAHYEVLCFEPRHIVRATKGGHAVELLVCFECENVGVELDGKPLPSFLRMSKPLPVGLFNRTLRAAGVPVASDLELEQFLRSLPW